MPSKRKPRSELPEDKREELRARDRQYREDNLERERAKDKKRDKNPERKAKRLAYNRKTATTPNGRYLVLRAHTLKEGRIPFTLTKEQYTELVSLPCFYCKNKLGVPVSKAAGLDRLDNSRGYEPDNCVSSCRSCNVIRGHNLTPGETLAVVQAVIEFRETGTTNLPPLSTFPDQEANAKLAAYLIAITPPVPKTRHNERVGTRYCNSKVRAKMRAIGFTLTKEEYFALIREPCYYCEYRLGDPVKVSVGLDRLDPAKDYEQDNVVSCCTICNQIRNDVLTPEENKIAVRAILNYRLRG